MNVFPIKESLTRDWLRSEWQSLILLLPADHPPGKIDLVVKIAEEIHAQKPVVLLPSYHCAAEY